MRNLAHLMRGRAFAALLLAGSFCGAGSGRCWAANTNPTVNFQTNTTNATNPIGRNFYLRLYSLSGFTNIRTIDNTNSTNTTQSNNLVVFAANFTNPSTNTNLVAPTGFNGLRFDPSNGVLYGIPTNNFILTISNNGLQVVSTNLIWTNQTIFSSNGVVISNTTNSASNATATSYTNTLTTNPAYRFVFQAKPVLSFTNTNMTVGITNSLPTTNSNGLTFAYVVTNGPGYVTNSTNLVATNAGLISLQVVLNPTNSANVLWSSVTNSFPVTAINPNATGFGFITNTNAETYTRTNLVFRQATPLALSNPGTSTFSWDPSNAAEKFESNGATWLRALSGSGSLVVIASRAATPTSSVTTASLTLTLSRAPNPVTMSGFFSNYPATNSITNTNTTFLTLLATASNGTVDFATTNANVQITNGTTLRLLANGTSTVVASVGNANSTNYLPADPVTNTLIVNWPSPAAPVFTSTNRQNGTVGTAFAYTLSAAASNTNAFPVTYAATNLPEGLTFTPANQISGTPTQAGFYRIQLTASNGGGASTLILTSAIAPSPAFTVTNLWTNWVALGSGTNTNGVYSISNLPAGIGTNITNPIGFAQPVLLLANTNTNVSTTNWFAGATNLSLVFSNSQTNLTSSIPLNVQPVAPGLSLASSVVGTPGVLLSVTNAITPAALTNISGYPLFFRATNLPDGMFFNAASGVISGKPVFAGQRTALVWVSNAIGASPTGQVTFDIQALAGAPMQMSLAFTSAVGTYSVLNLPPGLILSSTSGLVMGNPQAVGTFDLTVNFVRSGTAITNSTNRILFIRPPAPIPRVSSNLVTARTGRPFHFQPWVTGPGWGWAGADPLTATNFSTHWTNQILIGTSSVVLSSNSNGGIRPTTNGLTFTNRTNYNELYLLWRSNLPSSWPWQAFLRLSIPGSLTNSNAYAYPVLGAIRARSPSFPTNYLDDYADGGLLAESTNGVFPTATFYSPSTNAFDSLDSQGTNEIAVRFQYDTNNQTLVIAANTNPATNVFVGLITNTNLGADWSLTNAAAAFRLALGSSFSNQAVSSNQILLRSFAVLPRGVGFYASNLPPGLNCDPETGTIYGTPTNTFSGLIYLYATNSQGTNFTGFRLQIIR